MIVYTVGTFDLLHVGHLALLEYCGVPVIPLDQRMEMLKALRCVDIVRPYHELEYVSGCKELKVDIFVIGEDWGKKLHNINVESYLKSTGKKIIQVPYNSRTSSTRIKENTLAQSHRKNYIEQAVEYH
jgi:glycerol-3-phosphate cytidylyltransferase-like family protein